MQVRLDVANVLSTHSSVMQRAVEVGARTTEAALEAASESSMDSAWGTHDPVGAMLGLVLDLLLLLTFVRSHAVSMGRHLRASRCKPASIQAGWLGAVLVVTFSLMPNATVGASDPTTGTMSLMLVSATGSELCELPKVPAVAQPSVPTGIVAGLLSLVTGTLPPPVAPSDVHGHVNESPDGVLEGETQMTGATDWEKGLAQHGRALVTYNVAPGAGTLQAALNAASARDELVLADGTYTGSGSSVLEIGKSITIRALNPGQAVLDGENARGVISITSGTIALHGLNITKGNIVSSCSQL